MATEKSRLAKNIKFFRDVNGETQLDLSLALGFNSTSRIAMYETDRRTPSSSTIAKIAKHYRITESDLINGDFSNARNRIKIVEKLLSDTKAREKLADVFFPMICSEEALNNPNFKKAYNIHLAYKKASIDGVYTNADIQECIKGYIDSGDLIESTANLTTLCILFEIGLHNNELLEGALLYDGNKIDINKFYKDYFLVNEDYPSSLTNVGIDINELSVLIDECLKELRENNEYAFLVNYLVAIRYIYNCIENENTSATNGLIGGEMLLSELKLGNPYAVNFFRIMLYYQ